MSDRPTWRSRITGKRLVLWTTALAVVGLIVWAVWPDPLEVEMAQVRRGPLQVVIEAEGRTRARERFAITAPVAGRLVRMSIAEGATVRAGEPIAWITPVPLDVPNAREARARVEAARARRLEIAARTRAAEAALRQAKHDEERARRLLEAGAVAPRAVEAAELDVRARTEELSALDAMAREALAAEKQAATALLHLETGAVKGVATVVTAPADGQILRVADRSARTVAPGETLAELGDIGALELVLDVLSTDAGRVRPGMRVLLPQGGDERTDKGTVRLIEPGATTKISALGVEEQRVSIIVDIPPSARALGDGYRMDGRIVLWSADDVLTAPVSALVRNRDGWAVYVVEGRRIAERAVHIGQLGTDAAEVLDGVRAGEQVVVFPSDKVRPGVRVASN